MNAIVRCVLLISVLAVQGCAQHINMSTQLDLSERDHIAAIPVVVKRAGNYSVGLSVISEPGLISWFGQMCILEGCPEKAGLTIPVRLIVTGESKPIHDGLIFSYGMDQIRFFMIDGELKRAGTRRVKELWLEPGAYSIVLQTLEDVPDLENYKTYMSFYSSSKATK